MKLTRLAVPALALTLLGTALPSLAQGYGGQGYGGPPPPPHGYDRGYQGGGGWDAPPQELREFQRQGFRDGIQGAQRDFENHRQPNPNNRDEFRHPNVPRNVRGDYKEGFRRGYFAAVNHMQGGRGPGRPY